MQRISPGFVLFFSLFFCSSSYSQTADDVQIPPQYAESVNAAFDMAGDNRAELEDALKAAKEMFTEYPDALDAMAFTVAQTRHRGFLKGEFLLDCASISAGLLRGNLRLALEARKQFPWCASLAKDEWLRFVLPYRCTTESLVDWRAYFWNEAQLQAKIKEYVSKFQKAQSDEQRVEIFDDMIYYLNSGWLAARITYAPRGTPDLNPLESFEMKKVRCTDLTIATICLLRTYGIAATSVRCVWWPKENSNHTWTCVYCPIRKKWLDIESGLSGEKNTAYFAKYRNDKNKPHAKVYRVVPGEENGVIRATLAIPRGEFWPRSIDRYLVLKPMVDVTSEYTRTAKVIFKGFPPGALLYLAVWNDKQWSAVAGARAVDDGSVAFDQVGCYDCRYLLAHCVAGELQTAKQPFTLCEDGSMKQDPLPEPAACVVVLSEETAGDAGWNAVADALVAKHKAAKVTYKQRLDEVRLDVALRLPRHVIFVAKPTEATQKFIKRVHEFTRALDSDPYGDAIWGIVTGYTAADALKLAQAPAELTVRRCLAGLGSWGGLVEDFTAFSECKQNLMWRKEASDEKPRELECPSDATQSIVERLNKNDIDMMWTSGHATEKDWSIGYSFQAGSIITAGGKLIGASLKGARFPVETTNPKIYFAPGNCLIGNIADAQDSMCLSWLRAGAIQFVGYTVPTWYGYMGWGIGDYFFELQDTFSFAESFFLNNQALLWDVESGGLPKGRSENSSRNLEGHLYDRDVVVLYGDPVVQARLARHVTPRFTQSGSVTEIEGKPGKYRINFSISTARGDSLPRPAAFFFPRRFKNFADLKSDSGSVLLTDSFLLMSVDGALKEGETRFMQVTAEELSAGELVLAPLALEEGRLAPWERVEAHNRALVLLGKRDDPAALRQAVELLGKIVEADSQDVVGLYNMACALALLNEKEKALEFLEKAVEAGWDDAAHTKIDSDLEILREEPRFRELLDKMQKK